MLDDLQPGQQLGVLRGLFRYPVKSLTGETLDRVRIDGLGLVPMGALMTRPQPSPAG